ncbi:MAG: bla regulator protein BlaR1 [Sediminicola sp.]|jgi:bla regulator protein BlaR1
MTHYILQILAFQLLFLVVYDLFLKNETFFKWNRLYLIVTPLLSLILPLIKIDLIRQNIPEQFMMQLPATLIGISQTSPLVTSEALDVITIYAVNGLSYVEIGQIIWGLGALVSFGVFCFKLYKISKLKRLGIRTTVNGLRVYNLPNSDTAFSFFKNIFLGEQLSEAQKTTILLHEKIHIDQRHSLDLMFFEVLRILFWFNPLVYIYQNKMVLLQEFTADAEVAALNGKRAYYEGLLSQVFKTESISFINTFFNHSLIRKRVTMLQKSKSKKIFQLKYLLLVPVVAAMLVYTSCSDQAPVKEVETIVISETEVMDKINELAEAIMKKGNISDEEVLALKFLSKEHKEGDKIYTSVDEYLVEQRELAGLDYINESNTEVKVPFSEIDKVPVFPGCEGLDAEASKKCFTQKISAFIGDNFKTENLKESGLSGKQRIITQFVINKEGQVIVKAIKANHPDLEAEALSTLNQLPIMIPGVQDGMNVAVEYSLPIIFVVE